MAAAEVMRRDEQEKAASDSCVSILMRELTAAQVTQVATTGAADTIKMASSAADEANPRLLANLAASPGTCPIARSPPKPPLQEWDTMLPPAGGA